MTTIIVGRGRSKATQRIEIDDPTVSREHCRLTDNGNGTYSLENISSNGTYVDGNKVLKATVKADTLITIGQHTTVKVSDLFPPYQPSVPKSEQRSVPNQDKTEEYSIAHLEKIWNDYHDYQLEVKNKQRNIGLMRSASPIFTIGSGAIATLSKTMDWGGGLTGLCLVMTVLGIVLMIYSFAKGVKDKSIEETDAANTEFQHKYVCPKCNHFLGNQSYHLVSQNKNCPWCKCKFKK